MFFELAQGAEGGLEHLLVKEPFLETETAGTFFPIDGLIAKELSEGLAGGVGAMVVEGGGAGFPAVAGEEAAEAVRGTAEGGRGGLARGPWDGQLQPGGKELVIGARFVGLAGPERGW
jgi:hypothetical protein